jgi:hypothetical protein
MTLLRHIFAAVVAFLRNDAVQSLYSKVWLNTLGLAAVQTTYYFQKLGIKPDGIINFLSNEPPIQKQL